MSKSIKTPQHPLKNKVKKSKLNLLKRFCNNDAEFKQAVEKERLAQKVIFYNYLLDKTATASMVSSSTGIPQKCITRYKREFEEINQLWEVKQDTCKVTGFKAYYITTDPEKAPSNNQLKLFDV